MNDFLLIPLKDAEAAIADEDQMGEPIGIASALVRRAINSRSQNDLSQAAAGECIHVPPSPGQSMCQCLHMQVELEYAIRLADRALAERASRPAPGKVETGNARWAKADDQALELDGLATPVPLVNGQRVRVQTIWGHERGVLVAVKPRDLDAFPMAEVILDMGDRVYINVARLSHEEQP